VNRNKRLATIAAMVLVVIAVGTTAVRIFLPTPTPVPCPLMEDATVTAPAIWVTDATPELDIRGENEAGDLLFEQARTATILSDGRIVIADMMALDLKFFDSSGELIRTVGRKGEGPSEFSDVDWLGRCGGDSLYVYDSRNTRLTVMDGTGAVARMNRLPATAEWIWASIACSPTGKFVAMAFPLHARIHLDGDSPFYKTATFLLDASGNVLDTLGEFPIFENRPLGKRTRMLVTDSTFLLATMDSSAIDVYGYDGQHSSTLFLGGPIRPMTEHHYRTGIISEVATQTTSSQGRAQFFDMLIDIPMPEYLPPYSDVLLDSEGLVWAVLSLPGDSLTYLRATDVSGSIVADVQLPVEVHVYEIGQDYILAGYDAEDGQPHVVKYRMRRGD